MSLKDKVGCAASVLLILIYAQVWFGIATDYGSNASDHLGAVFLTGYAISLAMISVKPTVFFRAIRRLPFLIILLTLCTASIYWSIDPEHSSRRVPGLIFTSLGGLALAMRWPWHRFVQMLAISFAVMAAMSLLLGLVFPDLGRMTDIFPGAWRGVWLEKNSLGAMMALGALVQLAAAAMNPQQRVWWISAATLSFCLTLLSTSKTSLLILLMGLSAQAFLVFVKGGPARAIIGTWSAVVAVAAVAGLLLVQSDLILDGLGKDSTLTGRTKIWSGIQRQMVGEEWTGFGFGAFWDTSGPARPALRVAADADFMPPHAHNGWLEGFLAIGYPGVIVFGLWLLQMWLGTIRALFTSNTSWLLLPFMIAYTTAMLTESITLNVHDPWWVLFVAVSARMVLGDDAECTPRHRTLSRSPADFHKTNATTRPRDPRRNRRMSH